MSKATSILQVGQCIAVVGKKPPYRRCKNPAYWRSTNMCWKHHFKSQRESGPQKPTKGREAKRKKSPDLDLCICGHSRNDHSMVTSVGCYWSLCGCREFKEQVRP